MDDHHYNVIFAHMWRTLHILQNALQGALRQLQVATMMGLNTGALEIEITFLEYVVQSAYMGIGAANLRLQQLRAEHQQRRRLRLH